MCGIMDFLNFVYMVWIVSIVSIFVIHAATVFLYSHV